MLSLFDDKYGSISKKIPYLAFFREAPDGVSENYGLEYRLFDFESFINNSKNFLFEDIGLS
jgi:hypothetical protein